MKKAVVIFIIALVAVASAFAFEFKSIGLETGVDFINDIGLYAVSGDMEIIDNLDVYGRLGAMGGLFDLSVGAIYKVYEFEVQNTKIDVKPGAQMSFCFGDAFFFSLLGICEFSFNTGHFEAFARPGIGFGVSTYKSSYSSERYTNTLFWFGVDTGVRYIF